jgi:hypothetical protein
VLGWGTRQRRDVESEVGNVLPTKVLGRFLDAIARRPSPVLIDLGAVVGSNVTFLGDRLGCRLTVEDLFSDLDRFTRGDRLEALPAHFASRLAHADQSVDGVLCWNLFDYLGKPAAAALGAELVRILAPGGALMALFSTVKTDGQPGFTRFVIRDDETLEHRPYAGSCGRQQLLTNRDVALLFPGLKVTESFLLLSHTREVLFRR